MPVRTGAHVVSSTAIADFESALGRFYDRTKEALSTINLGLTRRLRSIQQACEAKAAQIDSLKSDVGFADEENFDYYQDQLAEAEAELEELSQQLSEISDSYAKSLINIQQLKHTVEEEIPRARHEIRKRLGLLSHANAVELSAAASGISTNQSAILSPGNPIALSIAEKQTSIEPGIGSLLTNYPLPRDFVWVSLAAIDLEHELAGVASSKDFQKVSYDEIRLGFELLKQDILPRMFNDPQSRKSSYWGDLDRENGLPYEKGSQRIFEAFFSPTAHIYLVRGKDNEKFDITNGRHRIKVAEDLGWDAIPAQIKDLKQS